MRENPTDPVGDFDALFDDESLWKDSNGADESDLVGVGLINCYNTCYMNSALQVLFCTVPLVTKLRDVTCQKHSCDDDSDFCCLKALKELFKLCMQSHSAVHPEEFLQNFSKISPNLRLGYHEDSHEFLLNLLEQIDKNCNGVDTDKHSLVREVFGIHAVVQDFCCNCRRLTGTFDPMFFLTLPISGVSSLTDALESYINIEERKGVKCERCNESVRFTRTLIEQAPKVMSFQFNRYNNSMEKDYTAMEYPLELDLRPFILNPISDEQTEYELYAVVDHMGCSTYGGHYLCYVRTSTTTWHEKNDHIVCKVTEYEVLNKLPYMLFYVKKGTPWFASLDKSEFTSSPKSVLSPASSSVAEETPDKLVAINDKEIQDSHDSEKYVFHEESPSSSHTYCDFENCVTNDDSSSTSDEFNGLQENHQKMLNCDSQYPSSTYNDAPACQIQPQATKRQKGDGHVIGVEHVADDGNFEEDNDKENHQAPHMNQGQNLTNNEATGSILMPTRNTSNINPTIKNVLKDKPKNRRMQLVACIPQESSGIKKSRLSSMSAPLGRKRQASEYETDPKFEVFTFNGESPNAKQSDTEPHNKSFSCKSLSANSARRLF